MPLLCKQKALYVKGCVIANGITDSQGDTLYTEDIKKIFTSFNNQDNFEIYHEALPLDEVSLLENYISTADESIGNLIIPAGSWNVVIRVDNPDIQQGLLTGELGGISLSNRIAPRCKGNLRGTIRYQDIADTECVVPVFISFVERGANGFGLHVFDYDAYILKSKDVEFEEEQNGGKIMDFKEFLNGLKSLIKEAETPEEEEPVVEKEDEETKEEAEVTATEEETEVEETETEAEEEPVVEKEDEEPATEEEESEEEEATIEKEDEETASEPEDTETTEAEIDLEARVAKLEEIVAQLTAELEETDEEGEEESETPDPETEPEDEDTPKITKSEKVIIENTKTVETSNYYTMSGRDPLTGKKIRN